MNEATHELNIEMLDAVAGGLKWQPGTRNDDVIDARGGQIKIFGFTVTLDIKGNPSSITF
ncbi:MAG: hypothetical protein PS018_04275 [bacterium]|nr:hypothetical protein [bacterium]